MKVSPYPPAYAMLPLRLLNASASMIETLVPVEEHLPDGFSLLDFESRFGIGGLVHRTFQYAGT